jgi:recombination DNA repair RAD52 pathway protein
MIGLKLDRPKPKTSDHQSHPTMRHVEITDTLLLTLGCQQSKKEEEDDRIQQVTANVDRKLSMEAAAAQHHSKDDSYKKSIDALKMRLFLATAVLWVVWLLVYVILSHWRLI